MYDKEYQKEYRTKHKEKVCKQNRKYQKQRKTKDPLFKLACNTRTLVCNSFKRKFTNKSKKTIEILGCNFEEFKIYLEKQFKESMNWQNQGSFWELDHIKPVSLAVSQEELLKLNHYTNFQPLEKNLNRSKYNNYF